jgi:hypothetical protein
MQPDALTRMALGVIANVEGTVTGKGRIDWNARGVTSSGRFSSTGLDLAAAFGPARGLAGTVEFTDLLNMVTAPNQTLRVAAINPGIEVNDGVVVFAMEPGQVLKLHSAAWPFLGGKLSLEPTVMRVGVAETRRYTLVIEGLDAAKFLSAWNWATWRPPAPSTGGCRWCSTTTAGASKRATWFRARRAATSPTSGADLQGPVGDG